MNLQKKYLFLPGISWIRYVPISRFSITTP